jgi:predicted transcriptional regulator
MLVSKITVILEMLGDGKWHSKKELLLKLELNEYRFQEITAFLSRYDFVKVDQKKRRVKINRDFQKLLAQAIPSG